MSSPRDRVRHHLVRLRSAVTLVATVSTLPSVVACDPAPTPHVLPLVEPTRGQIEPGGGVLAVTLPVPSTWTLARVDVVRGGSLVEVRGNLVRVKLGEPGSVGLFVSYLDSAGRAHNAAFDADTSAPYAGSPIRVTQTPIYSRD